MPRIDVPFTVTEQVLRQYPPTLLRAGDRNYFYATFDVCEKWDDVADLRAVFERSDLERPYVQDLVQGSDCYECVIPWEVMQTPGLVRVGVFGGDRILTNKVEVSVSVGCRCDNDSGKLLAIGTGPGGVEITEAEYNALLFEIREKADLVNKLYNGEITIDAVPADWQEEIQRRVDERIAAEGSAEEQDISAEEALEILLGGAT